MKKIIEDRHLIALHVSNNSYFSTFKSKTGKRGGVFFSHLVVSISLFTSSCNYRCMLFQNVDMKIMVTVVQAWVADCIRALIGVLVAKIKVPGLIPSE